MHRIVHSWGILMCLPPDAWKNSGDCKFSYDFRNWQYEWCPCDYIGNFQFAFDVEHLETPVPDVFLNYLACSPDYFLSSWTATEVIAKLTNTPILKLLKQIGLINPEKDIPYNITGTEWNIRLITRTFPAINLIVTFGYNVRNMTPCHKSQVDIIFDCNDSDYCLD